MEVGERIRQLRERKDWSQKKVADITHINTSVYNRIEKGTRKIRTEELIKIADALGVSVGYLSGVNDGTLTKFSKETQDILDNLDLTDEQLRKKFPFEIDGRQVTDEEFKWFIASVRSRRQME